MIMKGSITPAIRGAIPDLDNAMSYIKSVEEQFLGTSKSLAKYSYDQNDNNEI